MTNSEVGNVMTNAAAQPNGSLPAWSEYAIAPGAQWFDALPGKITRYNIKGLTKLASNASGNAVFVLDATTGEVLIQRTGRFTIAASTYVQGSIQGGNSSATIDVMGAIVIRIPPNPIPNPGISTHELRIGQAVIPLCPLGNLQDSGFSFSGSTTLMLPAGTKISLRVGIFADNLNQGTFIKWQARNDSAAGGAHLSIHEIPGG
jgi:hypothetical protein